MLDLVKRSKHYQRRSRTAKVWTADGVGKFIICACAWSKNWPAKTTTRFNLKKGRGGLMDIEFLTQMLQLTHGYRFPNLRRRGTLEALTGLYRGKIFKRDDYRLLSGGYLFLRRLDHRLRLERDQSIDAFEAEPGRLDGIAEERSVIALAALGEKEPRVNLEKSC